MCPRIQSPYRLLPLLTIALAALLGLVIPLGLGGFGGAAHPDWTPPVSPPAATLQPVRLTLTGIETPSRTPTSAVRPTVTVGPTQSRPTNTPTQPRPTSMPVPSPTDLPQARISNGRVNLRSGPGKEFGVVGMAKGGEQFGIVGRSKDGSWVELCCLNAASFWVAVDLVELPADLASYPIIR